MSTRNDLREAFVNEAFDACGYRALPNRGSNYGSLTGYPNAPWNGSFIAATAQRAGVWDMPALTDTVAGLQQFTRKNRLFQKPRRGDIVFAVAAEKFGMPTVAVVTDETVWKTEHKVFAIAGEVASGLPRASTTANGVFEREFFEHDILGFGRPEYRAEPKHNPHPESNTTVRASHFATGSKATARIETLQLALNRTVGLRDAVRGKFDAQTRSAYAQFQRLCGKVGPDANGQPDTETLAKLGTATGLFTVKE